MHGEKKLDSTIYRDNLDFWQRAWGQVKTAYTQMPDLPYLGSIPASLQGCQAKRILDLGCGSGWLSIYLARRDFDVTGIDIAEPAIALARKWAQDEQLPINFQVADISEIGFRPASFDAVVANSIFEHLTYDLASKTIASLATALVPGGIFFGCFDKVGSGPGEYYELEDKTHIYTDKARAGMLLRFFNDDELRGLFTGWDITSFETIESGSRIIWAKTAK